MEFKFQRTITLILYVPRYFRSCIVDLSLKQKMLILKGEKNYANFTLEIKEPCLGYVKCPVRSFSSAKFYLF